MTVYVGDYTTDLGYTFYGVSLLARFVSVRQEGEIDLDPEPYLPLTFKTQVRAPTRRQPTCPLRITPRETWLYLASGDYFRVVVPFQVGSIFWSSFHTELSANLAIVKVARQPEQIDPYILNLLLG